MDIMNRLPMKSLLQFRVVSKQWKFSIDSFDFIRFRNFDSNLNVFSLKLMASSEGVGVGEFSPLKGDVVLRESYQPNTRGNLWKEERVRLLLSSSGSSSTPSYSSEPSSPNSYSSGSTTPQNHQSGTSISGGCSNCKHLLGKIKVLEAAVEMHMHPEQHTRNSTALLHELYNDMDNLGLE
ncbi:transposase, MuDR, MULE transposase domain protein [Tanacetum coccineum]